MKHLLSSTAFLVLNKQLAKQIGLHEAVLLADLISKEEYFIANGMTDGWFFNTLDNIEADTTLTPFMQRKCLKTLKKHKIIEVKRKGVPAKNYFKINEQQVVKILNNLKSKKCTTINKNKETIITNKYFNRPTLEELKDYCLERQNNVDAEAFIDFYDSKDWKIGKNRMKCWKAAVRTWERRETKRPTMSKLDAQINAWTDAKKLL